MRFPVFPILFFLVLMVAVPPAWGFGVAMLGFLPWLLFGFILWAIFGGSRHHRAARRGWWGDGSNSEDDGWRGWQSGPARPSGTPRYARGAAQWSARSQSWTRPQPRPSRPPAPAPTPPAAAVSGHTGPRELPIDVLVKVEQIKRKASILERYADRFPPYSQDLYLVRQTTADYLPRTIEAFQALPVDQVERLVPGTGRTAHQELLAQLDLLDAKLDTIARDLQRQDADKLLANRKFLEMRLESRGDGAADPPAQDDPEPMTPHTNGVAHLSQD